MRKQYNKPIDREKLRQEITRRGLNFAEVSDKLGYNRNQISSILHHGFISKPVMTSLESIFNIKYEDYKPEEPKIEKKKEELVEEKPKTETEVISKDEALLKTIIAQLAALNNGLSAIYKKLEQIDADIKVWEE